MRYLLDSNTCIQLLTGRQIQVSERLRLHAVGDVFLCPIVAFELAYGAFKSARPAENLRILEAFCAPFGSLPFDRAAALAAGELRAALARQGTPIGPYDLLIAAIALVQQATLVTHNVREFSRVNGLMLEDWET